LTTEIQYKNQNLRLVNRELTKNKVKLKISVIQ